MINDEHLATWLKAVFGNNNHDPLKDRPAAELYSSYVELVQGAIGKTIRQNDVYQTRVEVSSSSSMPLQLFDWGTNDENEDRLLTKMREKFTE